MQALYVLKNCNSLMDDPKNVKRVRVRKRDTILGRGVVKFPMCVYKFFKYDNLVNISNSALSLLFL